MTLFESIKYASENDVFVAYVFLKKFKRDQSNSDIFNVYVEKNNEHGIDNIDISANPEDLTLGLQKAVRKYFPDIEVEPTVDEITMLNYIREIAKDGYLIDYIVLNQVLEGNGGLVDAGHLDLTTFTLQIETAGHEHIRSCSYPELTSGFSEFIDVFCDLELS